MLQCWVPAQALADLVCHQAPEPVPCPASCKLQSQPHAVCGHNLLPYSEASAQVAGQACTANAPQAEVGASSRSAYLQRLKCSHVASSVSRDELLLHLLLLCCARWLKFKLYVRTATLQADTFLLAGSAGQPGGPSQVADPPRLHICTRSSVGRQRLPQPPGLATGYPLRWLSP